MIDLTEIFVEDHKTIFTSDKIRIELSKYLTYGATDFRKKYHLYVV